MDKSNRPQGRKKHITEGGQGVHKRGEGLHMGGPVGGKGTSFDRTDYAAGESSGNHTIYSEIGTGLGTGTGTDAGSGMRRARGVKLSLPVLILAVLLFGGNALFSGSDTGVSQDHSIFGELLGGGGINGGSSGIGGWTDGGRGNTGKLDTSVASGAREKRTVIQGNGKDTITIMVYMCGTDLESNAGMATADLQEMASANISDKVNLLVYTGGCTGWRNSAVSSKVNQIYQVKDGGLVRLVEDAGDVAMTKPETLSGYIKWCDEKFSADRRELILWDHGGGSVSGYGYDQKYPNSGSMSLAGIHDALDDAGVTFDFIGFDACLMATLENGLMLAQYADYMIASEETEPGVGWYYTDWLTKLSENTSIPTLELGKYIVDDFVEMCNQKCRGQQTTLSVVDLAELEKTAPEAIKTFSKSAGKLIQSDQYGTVSNARSQSREFARSSGIDQVDLVHLAENMATEEGKQLADVVKSAVKYNQTSSNMTNAYGVSIYFPYKKLSSVDRMVNTYEKIGMDEEYSRCIQEFASVEAGGQTASVSPASPLPALLEMLDGGNVGSGVNSGGSDIGSEAVMQLLEGLLSGDFARTVELDDSNTDFLDGKTLKNAEKYLTKHQFDASQLTWEDSDGTWKLCMDEEQWDLVQTLELNMFYDDGEGYIDLGLDNVFEFDDDGNLLGENDRTWLAINGQPVAYYFLDETDNGENHSIHGRVPAMLNGQRVDLILTFDEDNPYGYIAGARMNYVGGETETVAKGFSKLQDGDKIDFLCDYYTYDGTFQDNYYLGEQMTVEGEPEISNVSVGEGDVRAVYRFTDIYNQHYWTPPIPD